MRTAYLVPAFLALTLSACAQQAGSPAQPQQEATAEQYICADPEIRVAKGGQAKCEAFYAGYRVGEDPCAKASTTLECVKILRGLEVAGFTPKQS